jgi:hypothetical protein
MLSLDQRAGVTRATRKLPTPPALPLVVPTLRIDGALSRVDIPWPVLRVSTTRALRVQPMMHVKP